jgi:hypothetical protein
VKERSIQLQEAMLDAARDPHEEENKVDSMLDDS